MSRGCTSVHQTASGRTHATETGHLLLPYEPRGESAKAFISQAHRATAGFDPVKATGAHKAPTVTALCVISEERSLKGCVWVELQSSAVGNITLRKLYSSVMLIAI